MKRLIVNADDFGRSPGVNQGIFDSHRKGILTSTTVMVNYPDAPAGLEQARVEAPTLGLGVHICLTSGHPVLPPAAVPSLVKDDGWFYHIREWAGVAGQFDPDDLRREMEAQVERFVSLTGQPPDHLDSHHHAAYLHPAALASLLDIAAERGLPLRNAGLDGPPDEIRTSLGEWIPGLPAGAASGWIEQLQAVLADGPTPFWPARLEPGFYGPRATLGDLLLILANLPEESLTEIMCHPGYVDEALASSGYTTEREAEVDHLTHTATRECVRAEGIVLIPFGKLTRH
jgi:predicted glycoside hydrolase/deacetylase ChbG (UPF0249 family)